MRTWTLAAALALAGCGEGSSAPPPPPSTPAAKAVEVAREMSGKYPCVKCNLRTNEETCPQCKTPLAPKIDEAPRSAGEVGKSAVAPRWACPVEGCDFTDARKDKCLKHADTDLKEQWFACAACGVKEPVEGKCAKCGTALKRTLQ
jgi:hypothetical protein